MGAGVADNALRGRFRFLLSAACRPLAALSIIVLGIRLVWLCALLLGSDNALPGDVARVVLRWCFVR